MKLDSNQDRNSLALPCWERGQQDGRSRPLNVDILYKNLLEVKEVFDKFGVRFWLSHGTVLGVHRGNEFILHDDDADVSADFSQRELAEEAAKELRTRGFYIPQADPTKPVDNENAPYFDLHIIREGSKVEVWFFEKRGSEYIYDFPRCGRALAHPAKYYDTLGTINFKGVTFNCPNELHNYLVMMYGSTYMTPDPNKKYNNQT